MNYDAVKNIVDEVCREFYSRKGFDYWWDCLDNDTKELIKSALVLRIDGLLIEALKGEKV